MRLAPDAAEIRHVLLDRDGVLNREPVSGWITRPEDFHWEEGALEALRLFVTSGVRVSVVTNQSCIGRGLATAAEVERVNAHMVNASGKSVHAVFVCPHAPDDHCPCRKPAPGLLLQAIAASGIRAEDTLMVGDAVRDIEAGRAASVHLALVLTGKGAQAAREPAAAGIPLFESLLHLAEASGLRQVT